MIAPANMLALFGGVGVWEVTLILLAALLLFGGKKLPELARGLGRGLRLFKKELRATEADIDNAGEDEDRIESDRPKAASPAAPEDRSSS